MRWISALPVCLLGVVATLALPQNAAATTFANLTIEQFTDASTYIVEGVVQGTPQTSLEGQNVYTTATVRVTDTLKGPDRPETVEVRQLGGTFAGVTSSVPGQALFSDGEQVFLFLHATDAGALVPVSKFQGKYTVRRAPGERRTYVRQWQRQGAQPYDHRFLPHPEERVYLDELEGQVRARLETGWDGRSIPGLSHQELELANAPERRTP